MTTVAWFVRGAKHQALAEKSMAAALKANPHCLPVVATDDPEVNVPGARMVRFDAGLPLMVANLEAMLAVMWSRVTSPLSLNDEPIWFIDTDVVLLKRFPELIGEQIAVTWRDNLGGRLKDAERQDVAELMPYNFGVLGVVPGRRTFEALLWMRERVRVMAPTLRNWYGNQIALASLAGPHPPEGEATDERSIPWLITDPWPSIKVRKLPCETWNYTPAEAGEDVSMRGALHFKGHSRPLMGAFIERLAAEAA